MGILGDIVDTISERLDPGTIAAEMGAGLDKMAVQGAAEVGQALFTGSAYMPYGPTQAPIEVADAAPAADMAPQSYEQMLDSYSPPGPPVQQQETELERGG